MKMDSFTGWSVSPERSGITHHEAGVTFHSQISFTAFHFVADLYRHIFSQMSVNCFNISIIKLIRYDSDIMTVSFGSIENFHYFSVVRRYHQIAVISANVYTIMKGNSGI